MIWPFLIPIVVTILVVLVVVLAIAWERKRQRERTEAFRKVADEIGFDFHPGGGDGLRSEAGSFYLFQHGHSKQVRNLMSGQALELEVTVFDYEYTTGSGKHRHRWRQTAVLMRVPDLHLPDFTLRPENFWHKVGATLGFDDIDFADYPPFSKQYLLKGASEAAVRGAFTEHVLEYFTDRPGLNVEGRDDRVLVYRQARCQQPAEIRELMETGFEVLAVFRGEPAKKL